MELEEFRNGLLAHFDTFKSTLATDAGDWVVKGFIDVYQNIYTISVDTKVISKIIELMLFPVISRFAVEHGYRMILSEQQNFYPDISFVASDGTKIALDLKSTYRTGPETVNGFTLGAFTGYFRQRKSRTSRSLTNNTPVTLFWALSTAANLKCLTNAGCTNWTIFRTLSRC